MVAICNNCKYFYAPIGSEGRWMVCSNPKMKVADVYNNYKTIEEDGIGYSDQCYSEELAEIYVGKNFGCIHFAKKW